MQTLSRAIAFLAGLFFLAVGVVLLIVPTQLVGQFDLVPGGVAGYSTLRGDFGALFLGMAGFCLTGAVRREPRGLIVAAVFLALILLGRATSSILDGISTQSVRMMVVELTLVIALTAAAVSLRRQPFTKGMPSAPRAAVAIALTGAALLVVVTAVLVFRSQLGLALVSRTVDRGFANQGWVAALPDGLHVGLCGSGSPLADAGRAGPCVFIIAGKHLYLVDAGEGSPRKMALMALPPALIDGVFLTHFHSDHIGGLGEMLLQRWAGGSHADPTPVFGPPGVDAVVQGFNDAYEQDKAYRVAHHGAATVPPSGAGGVARPFLLPDGSDDIVVLAQDGLTVTAFPVSHEPVRPAVGYRFEYGGRSVVVSGDTAPSPALERHAQNVDILFHEGLQTSLVSVVGGAAARNNRPTVAKIMKDIPSYHTTPEDAARLAARARVKHLVFYHTIPPLPSTFLNAAFLGEAATFYHGPITVSRDGTMWSLPARSDRTLLRELL